MYFNEISRDENYIYYTNAPNTYFSFLDLLVTALPKKKGLINTRKRITLRLWYISSIRFCRILGRVTELRTNFCAEADSWHAGSRFVASSSTRDSLRVSSSFVLLNIVRYLYVELRRKDATETKIVDL